jgi:trypsin-like peptidase
MWSSRLARIFAGLTVAVSTSSFAETKSSGSGFAIGDGSSIVTDYHVVKSCSTINVPDIGSASVVKSDPKADLAILKPSKPLPIGLRFRSGHPVKLGEEIVVIGFPLRGLLSSGPTVTTGIVSSLAGIGGDRTQMQISAPVQPGNSGGPVLDKSGNVVGVVVSKLDAIRAAILTGDIPQNVNFAIQSSILTSVLDSYSIDYQVGAFDKEKPTSEIVSSVLPAVVVLECLGEQKLETVGIPPARPKELPPPPPDLPGKMPTIGASRSWSEQQDGRQKTYVVDNLRLTFTATQKGKDRVPRLDAATAGGPSVTVYGVPSLFTSLGATIEVLRLDPESHGDDVAELVRHARPIRRHAVEKVEVGIGVRAE